MKTIRFYVMEDSPDVLKEILEALEETPDCEAIGSSASIQDGYEQIIQLKPDALLLDISLIGGTAFELIQLMKNNNLSIPPVIIMTGNPDYAKAGIAVDVIGPALVKLIDKPFWKTWPKEFPGIKATILSRMTQLHPDDADVILRTLNAQEELYIRSSHMTYRIVVPEILYIDAEKGYTTLHQRGGRIIKVRKTLNDLLSKLPPYVCRISRDKAINLRHLDQIDHETDELFLSDCKENFFIGDPYKAALKEALGI